MFLVNRLPDRALETAIGLAGSAGFDHVDHVDHVAVFDADSSARTTLDASDRVIPRAQPVTRVEGERITVTLPPASWNMVTFSRGNGA